MENERQSTGRQSEGQALIQVALAMIVLLLLVGLAVDVGGAYAQRRHMQNAADAGALAGAYELCFGIPARAETTARQYATERNRAQAAEVDFIEDEETGERWGVIVEASTLADTNLTGILGFNDVNVAATAAAACGAVTNLCNIWPITFNIDRFNDIDCDESFYVWNDSSLEEEEPFCYTTDENGQEVPLTLCDACDCENVGPPDGTSKLIGSGSRGWVNFPRSTQPGTTACNNCGANQIISIIGGTCDAAIQLPGPGEHLCLPSQQGNAISVPMEIERNLGQNVNLLLWDDTCGEGQSPPDDSCPVPAGTRSYHIIGTGCFIALNVLRGGNQLEIMLKEEYRDVRSCRTATANYVCTKGVAIEAQKSCQCGSECGSTIGNDPPQPWEVRGVSLINPPAP